MASARSLLGTQEQPVRAQLERLPGQGAVLLDVVETGLLEEPQEFSVRVEPRRHAPSIDLAVVDEGVFDVEAALDVVVVTTTYGRTIAIDPGGEVWVMSESLNSRNAIDFGIHRKNCRLILDSIERHLAAK